MATINFRQGDIFEIGIGKYELCLFYGHHEMAFGLGYSSIKDSCHKLQDIESPFTTMPNMPSDYLDNKTLVCIPTDYIPNQASNLGLIVFKRLYFHLWDKTYMNLDTHGNCIAASIPIALHDAINEGKIKKGDIIMLIGTSAGFSISGVNL